VTAVGVLLVAFPAHRYEGVFRLWHVSFTVDTGPYAIVRHPIYTGILTALLGTVVVKGTVLGMLVPGLRITSKSHS
jgi:protein-S-isoprenylcysteine O-methyltransferase Ste14